MAIKATSDSPCPDTLTDVILQSISDGVFTVDCEWRITAFNRSAEAITGVSCRDAVGRPCSEVFRSGMCATECALRQTMKTGHPIVNRSGFIVAADGRRIPISLSTALLRDRKGRIIGGVESFRDLSLVEDLRKEISGRTELGDMVSQSHAMRPLFDLLPRLAESDSAILVQGETGTGKELYARTVHALGPRHDKPFVAVNCAALPDTLLESELFGYKAGAFTGARRDKPGRFALAEGGTLFLDEIGDISPALQVRLLRVLQDHRYEPLGGTHPVPTDVRVITATHQDLADLVAKGRFRRDLFYRIHVVRVELPPLRRRRDDIPLMVDRFVARLGHRTGKPITGIAPDALALLLAHDYPGNVRELENILEHAFILCPGPTIEPRHLPPELAPLHHAGLAPAAHPVRLAAATAAFERTVILDALQRHAQHRDAAARELGLHRATLFRKMRQLGMNSAKD